MTGGQKIILALVIFFIVLMIWRIYALSQLMKLAKIQKEEFDKEALILKNAKLSLKK